VGALRRAFFGVTLFCFMTKQATEMLNIVATDEPVRAVTISMRNAHGPSTGGSATCLSATDAWGNAQSMIKMILQRIIRHY